MALARAASAAVVLVTAGPAAHAAESASRTASAAPKGRPAVKLDLLQLGVSPLATSNEELLRKILAREARRVDWGAGRGAHITYRFRVNELEAALEGGVLRVSCSATGWLPKGKIAKSRISFGGSASERDALVERVLEVVARGVLTRLAEMERVRREQ